MSKESERLRERAAHERHESCNGGSDVEKAKNRKRAAAYTSLAENDEWLEGERPQGREL